MKALILTLTGFVIGVVGQAPNPAAFNPQLTNILILPGGPTLYYNGSGSVPPYDSLSPSPPPLPALT